MGQIKIATSVQCVHEALVGLVARPQPETNQVQRRGNGQLKTRVAADPARELLGQPDVLADMELQSFDSVIAKHEPQLQRAKPAAERNVPIAIIDDGPRFRGFVPQIFGKNAERLDQYLAVRNVKTVTIEVRKHPFVRIEAIAVGVLEAGVDVAKLRAERGSAGHGGVNV